MMKTIALCLGFLVLALLHGMKSITMSMGLGKRPLSSILLEPFLSHFPEQDRAPQIFDVLSIGSVTRLDYLHAQSRMLSAAASSSSGAATIRSFTAVTEMNDFDSTCSLMTTTEVTQYIGACRAGEELEIRFNDPNNPDTLFQFTPLNDTAKRFAGSHYGATESAGPPEDSMERLLPGWHCAQRRVLQGMDYLQQRFYAYNMLTTEDAADVLPDYLVVLDDDSYFNVDAFRKEAAHHTNTGISRVYSGCLFERNVTGGKNIEWEFPYGGMGVVYTKGAIKNLLTPLNCSLSATAQPGLLPSRQSDACKALQRNEIGEQAFYQPGMNTIDLFSNYSAHSKNFCLHSDWLVGYIAGRYLTVDKRQLDLEDNHVHTTFHGLRIWPYQCGNHSAGLPDQVVCDDTSVFCHKQTPDDFKRSYNSTDETSFLRSKKAVEIDDTKKTMVSNLAEIDKRRARKLAAAATPLPKKTEDASIIASKTGQDGHSWIHQLYKDTVLAETTGQRMMSNVTAIAELPSKWITGHQVLPESFSGDELAMVMHHLRHGKIISARSKSAGEKEGTQLKLFLELEGGAKAIFKPKRQGAGWDQHNAEIASWHVSRLVNLRRAPVSVGRRISIEKELLPIVQEDKKHEFSREVLCPDEDCDDTIEGVMILFLPEKFPETNKQVFLGYQRSMFPFMTWSPHAEYIKRRMTSSPDYCDAVVKKELHIQPRLLDMVETAMYDWLIQNTDRHTYEIIQHDVREPHAFGKDKSRTGSILLLDQGKSFGANNDSSTHDEPELLMPLIQCCILRDTTYEHFRWMKRWNMSLSDALLTLTRNEIVTPSFQSEWSILEAEQADNLTVTTSNILWDGELQALNRRMHVLWEAIDTCIQERGRDQVLYPSLEFSSF
jgi:hypothetical protein